MLQRPSAKDLGYGDTREDVSRLLNAYTKAILASDSSLPYPERDIQGEALA